MFKYFFSFLLLLLLVQSSNTAQASDDLKVAFNRHQQLWVKIGDKEKKIAEHGSVDTPEWSSDGNLLAYSQPGDFGNGENEIWVYNLHTGKTEYVTHNGHNYQWAPAKNILAFQFGGVLSVKDFRGDEPGSFYNRALGVDNYSWLPNGNGFLATTNANLHPDGWTNPILYQIKGLKVNNLLKSGKKFFVIPGTLNKGHAEILSVGTSRFKWSPYKNWIAFMVNPTASWSMDSNMLCVISKDGKSFEPVDEMARAFDFQWSPHRNILGYIEGQGRIVFGFTNKNLRVKELPAMQYTELTPKNFADLSFTWLDDENVIVSRTPEREWSNDPSKKALPVLVSVQLQGKQQQITKPSKGFGDFNPMFLHANQKLTWVRSNWKNHDVWISDTDGTSAQLWVKNVDFPEAVSWYNPKLSD